MKQKVAIFSGPPLSGKGTLSAKLSKEFGVPIFAPGAIYRALKEEDSELGRLVNESLKDGGFCPNELTNRIMSEELVKHKYTQAVILDGYPRNQVQLDYMLENTSLLAWFHLEPDYNVLEERLSCRRECSVCGLTLGYDSICGCGNTFGDRNWKTRFDDTPELFKKRYGVYMEATEPILNFVNSYDSRRYHVINTGANLEYSYDVVKSIFVYALSM